MVDPVAIAWGVMLLLLVLLRVVVDRCESWWLPLVFEEIPKFRIRSIFDRIALVRLHDRWWQVVEMKEEFSAEIVVSFFLFISFAQK
jgi:hypothetical protein